MQKLGDDSQAILWRTLMPCNGLIEKLVATRILSEHRRARRSDDANAPAVSVSLIRDLFRLKMVRVTEGRVQMKDG